MQIEKYPTKDSGQREEYVTGARRDVQIGKGRPDRLPWGWIEQLTKVLEGPAGDDKEITEGLPLIPIRPLLRLAALYGRGKIKYGANNWQKGFPLTRIFSSLGHHLIKWAIGKKDEDHLAAIAWNTFALIEIEARALEGVLPRELLDYGPEKVNYEGTNQTKEATSNS